MHTVRASHAVHSVSAAWEVPTPSDYERALVAAAHTQRPVTTPDLGDRYSSGELSIHTRPGYATETATHFE